MLTCSHIHQHSETTLSFYFGESIDVDLAVEIAIFAELLRGSLPAEYFLEIIPSYTSIFIEWDILKTNADALELSFRKLLSEHESTHSKTDSELIELPIYYHPEVAPDLESLAVARDLSIDEVIRIHSEKIYTVASMGFAPGFAYLAGLDGRLATPRMTKPKTVHAGSLGIADDQTAIYPNESPGGWNIIGDCPVSLFDLNRDPMTPFSIGMKVKFLPMTKEEFQQAKRKS